jgi:hypothetical protein
MLRERERKRERERESESEREKERNRKREVRPSVYLSVCLYIGWPERHITQEEVIFTNDPPATA